MIRGIHHVAISSPDCERLADFYIAGFGFIPVERLAWPTGTQMINTLMALPDTSARTVLLKLGDMHLELFEFAVPEQQVKHEWRDVYLHGITHLCFDTQDIWAEYTRLQDLGARFHCPPQDFGSALVTYGRDPYGNVFELQEFVTVSA